MKVAVYCSKLEMKISDIEFQGDGSKATFTTANDRIDFRALIKDFAKNSALVLR
jgi:cell fate regulator YaaT (PSP1 superfamily)